MSRHGMRTAVLGAALGVITALVYLPALPGQFVWDDVPLIENNPRLSAEEGVWSYLSRPLWDTGESVGTVSGLYKSISRPVTKLAYYVEYQLFGLESFGYHLVSLLLHLGCIVLAFRFLSARFGETHSGVRMAALAGAALFALHPSRVESVAWISGSTDLWMGFFALLSLDLLRRAERWAWLLGAVSLSLACLSKEPAVVIPALLILDRILLPAGSPGRPKWSAVAGASVGTVLGVICWALLWMQNPESAPWSRSAPVSFLTRLGALGGYVQDLLWPFALRLERPVVEPGTAQIATLVLVLGAWLLLATAGLVYGAVKSERLRPWLADLSWLLLLLAPVLAGSIGYTSPRYLYLPLLGLCALTARAVLVFHALPQGRAMLPGLAGGALLIAFAAVTANASATFQDEISLWTHQAEIQPGNSLVLDNLAEALEAEGARVESRRVYLRGMRVTSARGYESAHLHFALHIMKLETVMARSTDTSQLEALCVAYETLAREPELRLVLEGLTSQRSIPRDAWERELSSPQLFGHPRALAHVRAGHLPMAESMLRGLASSRTDVIEVWTLLSIVQARQGRFNDALGTLEEIRQRSGGTAGIDAAEGSVRAAAQRAARPVSDARGEAMRAADVQLVLGAPEAARRILAPVLWVYPGDVALVRFRMQVEVTDRRFDLARQVLDAAAAKAPDLPVWAQIGEQLDRAQAEAK